MKLTIGQINTTAGDHRGNTERIIRAIETARRESSELIAFPEAAIQGYTSADWFLDAEAVNGALATLDEIVEATAGITAVIGTVRPTGLRTGKRLYNSAVVIHDRKIQGYADKSLLPSYEAFDEPRYFESATSCHMFEVSNLRLGVTVCEDFWNDASFWTDRLYSFDPVDELLKQGANLIVALNASPFHKGKPALRRRMVQHRSRLTGVPMLFLNLVGGNDGSIFDGSSMTTNKNGDIVMQAPAFEEFVGTVDINRAAADERTVPEDEEALVRALELGIRDFVIKAGFEKAEVPMSDDANSRVVAALARRALGAANVVGRRVTAGTESQKIRDFAGIELRQDTGPEGWLRLSTFSKTDAAFGRCTSEPGLAVLGDIFTTEIKHLAEILVRSGGLPEMPENKDSASFNGSANAIPAEEIDAILKQYLEQNRSPGDIISQGHERTVVDDILNRIEAPVNELNRRVMPPVLAVSPGAFGPARRRPIGHRYHWPL